MTIPLGVVQQVGTGGDVDSWKAAITYAWEVCSPPVSFAEARQEVPRRDRALADLDLLLGSGAWDLWEQFDPAVPRAADVAAEWWSSRGSGRAVLILDGLSLREVPWLLEGAAARGFAVRSLGPAGAEIPGETSAFARGLGFGQRSNLENGAGASARFPGARTEAAGVPWRDCIGLVRPEPSLFFWHHWPDSALHDLRDAGKGVSALAEEAARELTSDDFWGLVQRLASGRQLLITSDHGYAATGEFPDCPPGPMADHLRSTFKAGRCIADPQGAPSAWLPPVELSLVTRAGIHRLALGRRKWKAPGGYPTLTHGGLSVLEALVPVLELTRS
jgi:hypothetical protein